MNGNNVGILLVDDDQIDAMNVKRAFKKVRITNTLYHAENGEEALAMLRGDGVEKLTPTPKIILLDLNMPRMNGLEFLHELRGDPQLKALSVIILTTSNEEMDKVAAYNLNVAGYILKPVGFDKFIEAVSALNVFWHLIEMP